MRYPNLAGMAGSSRRRRNVGIDFAEKLIGVDAANAEAQRVGKALL
jgi:hypothetical protein